MAAERDPDFNELAIPPAEDDDAEWATLVRSARVRLRKGFAAGEVDAKTAAGIVLADARLRERQRPDGPNPLEELGEAAAKVFGVVRTTSAKREMEKQGGRVARRR